MCLDANALAAGVVSQAGTSGAVVAAILEGRLGLVLSDDVEGEYLALPTKAGIVRLIARKGADAARFARIVDTICSLADWVQPVGEAPPCRDENDRKYLHCALTGRVDYLVTWDDDLLSLETIDGVPIITPAKLMHQLASERRDA